MNQVLKPDIYPLSNINDLLTKLKGAVYFCSIDLLRAYQQVSVNPESQELHTINTIFSLYRFTRLTYGITNAIFQMIMDKILPGLENVISFLDDIFIKGENLYSCYHNLCDVLKR